MDDWEVTLKAGEKLQEVLDVWGGKALADVVGSTNDLVLWEAEEDQSARNLLKGVVLEIPSRNIARAVRVDSRVDCCVQSAVRVAERRFSLEFGLEFGFDRDLCLRVGDGRVVGHIAGLGLRRLLVEHVRPVLSGGGLRVRLWLLHGVTVAVRGIIIALTV